MDKQLKLEIIATVKKAVVDTNEVYEERWLTDDELCKYVGIFTKRWLRENGYLLPRMQVVWKDKKGVEHVAKQYLYPVHKILAMVADGRISKLGFDTKAA